MAGIFAHFGNMLLELTPLQRWEAVTNPRKNYNSSSGPWLLIIGLFLVIVLAGLLVYIYRRRKESEKSTPELFDEYARARDLTDREYRVLLALANNAELMRPELIFKLPSVFDRESARLMENSRSEQGGQDSQQLEAELALIRQKLNFRQAHVTHVTTEKDTDGQSTFQIPVKKKLFIKANSRAGSFDLEATVVKNTSAGLTVQLNTPVEIVFGQSWTCRYFAGAFIAEFRTTVSKCSGQFVMLAHSNQVRQINRRRYQRVPIHKRAYVAVFPFTKDPAREGRGPRKKIDSVARQPDRMDQIFELPRFTPATVTEIGGPGLKINTALTLNVGDRVLILFKLDNPTKSASSRATEMMIEHIAKVRHVTSQKNEASAALELIGLHDEEMDELIQATNRALIKMKRSKPDAEDSETQNIWSEELVSV